MRNTPLHTVDAVARNVLAIGTDYTSGTLLTSHSHRRAQFLYGPRGLMQVKTDDGAWTIPPYSGVWIPAGKPHSVRMQGVSTRSLYIEPAAAPRQGARCEALVVTPLLHQLLLASADLPALYDEAGRDGALVRLLLHEVALARGLPLFAPLPRDERLAALCQRFLERPGLHAAPQDWAVALNKSLRTFSRFFLQQTGMAFGAWRQQACLLAAVSQLSSGTSVTQVALDLGYDSPSAFSAMFRKALGRSPSEFARQPSQAGADMGALPSQAIGKADAFLFATFP